MVLKCYLSVLMSSADLDAFYAYLYGLTCEELDYILDTFPIVRRKDEERYGEYRTKRSVLEYYEVLAGNWGSDISWRVEGDAGLKS
jgi:hypothetical protein